MVADGGKKEVVRLCLLLLFCFKRGSMPFLGFTFHVESFETKGPYCTSEKLPTMKKNFSKFVTSSTKIDDASSSSIEFQEEESFTGDPSNTFHKIPEDYLQKHCNEELFVISRNLSRERASRMNHQ